MSALTFEIVHHKLTGSANWRDWHQTVEMILTAEGLDDYILKDHVILTANDEGFSTWKKENARACLIIMLNCAQEPRNLISGLKTAKEMWIRLDKMY